MYHIDSGFLHTVIEFAKSGLWSILSRYIFQQWVQTPAAVHHILKHSHLPCLFKCALAGPGKTNKCWLKNMRLFSEYLYRTNSCKLRQNSQSKMRKCCACQVPDTGHCNGKYVHGKISSGAGPGAEKVHGKLGQPSTGDCEFYFSTQSTSAVYFNYLNWKRSPRSVYAIFTQVKTRGREQK